MAGEVQNSPLHAVCGVQCLVCGVQCVVSGVQCAVCSVRWELQELGLALKLGNKSKAVSC